MTPMCDALEKPFGSGSSRMETDGAPRGESWLRGKGVRFGGLFEPSPSRGSGADPGAVRQGRRGTVAVAHRLRRVTATITAIMAATATKAPNPGESPPEDCSLPTTMVMVSTVSPPRVSVTVSVTV